MFEQIRHLFFLRFIWGLLCVHILNFSINTDDFLPFGKAEDLSINDQESIVEFIVEKVLGEEDAFVEYEDPEQEDQSSKKQTNFQIYFALSNEFVLPYIPKYEVNSCPSLPTLDPAKGFSQLHNPPPK